MLSNIRNYWAFYLIAAVFVVAVFSGFMHERDRWQARDCDNTYHLDANGFPDRVPDYLRYPDEC